MPGEPDLAFLRSWLRLLNIAKEAYPAVLVTLFVASFIAHGVITAPDDGDKVQIHPMRGPGGRPLPIRRKSANQAKAAAAVKELPSRSRTILKVGQVGVVLTFLANAVVILFKTLLDRKDQWWPGKSAVVRRPQS